MPTEGAKKRKSRKEFFTRQKANEGSLLYLPDPQTGKPSEEWLRIRGVDSDDFRKTELAYKRRLLDVFKIKDKEEQEARFQEEKLGLLATLVMGWSWDDPCTTDVVLAMFHEAPYIVDLVNDAAEDRARFTVSVSASSSDTQSVGSGSIESSPVEGTPDEKTSSK